MDFELEKVLYFRRDSGWNLRKCLFYSQKGLSWQMDCLPNIDFSDKKSYSIEGGSPIPD